MLVSRIAVSRLLAVVVSLGTLTGCQTAAEHMNDVDNAMDKSGNKRLTVGTVQSQIKAGMSGGDVATVLGSPNIVSTDPNGNEVWIYDKIATDRAYSESSVNANANVLGGGLTGWGLLGGIGGVGGGSSAGAESTSQRTLTIVIKFDEAKKVKDIAYHTSRF